jgi:hypothetical protein
MWSLARPNSSRSWGSADNHGAHEKCDSPDRDNAG